MTGHDPGAYGSLFAGLYDELYPAATAVLQTEAAVTLVSGLARAGQAPLDDKRPEAFAVPPAPDELPRRAETRLDQANFGASAHSLAHARLSTMPLQSEVTKGPIVAPDPQDIGA